MTRAIHDALGWTRNAVQARILGQIFSQRVHDIAIKGGMAMRVAHDKVARATKDIDLDAGQDMTLATLQGVMRRAIRMATGDGLIKEVTISEPKQTDTTARWKVAGIDPRTGQVLNLTIEVSRREAIAPEDVREVMYCHNGGGDWVTVYTDQALVFRKVRALLSETREAPRDISDIYMLIQAKVEPPLKQIRAWLAEGGDSLVAQMWSKLERMDKAMFKAEVLPSLPPTPDGQNLYRDWDEIRMTVGEHVERWIQMAKEGEALADSPVSVRPSGTARAAR